jgi:hypothetical protein
MARVALVILILASLVACGRTPASVDSDLPATLDLAPVNDRLYVARSDGLSVVNVSTGKIERDLPPGILSPDRAAYWTSVVTAATTVVRKLDPASGTELARMSVPGAFALPSVYGPLTDALSPTGRYLVLVDAAGAPTFVVVDLNERKERARVQLAGMWTYDAIDEYATSLYLLEHPQGQKDRYNVRLFDLGTNKLDPRPIVDTKTSQPTAVDLARGTMGGLYHASTSAGLWHFGLYTSTSRGPTIHALNMVGRYAFCLVALNTVSTHGAAWAIAPSPKPAISSLPRVFAINAANGALASVRADTLELTARSLAVQQAPESDLRGAAAISTDGTRLYATGGKGIVVVDTSSLSLKAQYLADRQFVSVMTSADGTRLYVLERGGAISRIEPGTGRDLGLVARIPNAVSIVRID